jgi:chromosome partitioning protein
LLIDIDPQANASSGLGLQDENAALTIYEVLLGETPLQPVIQREVLAFLDLAPSASRLHGAEIELVSVLSRESRLQRALEPVLEDYEFVLIDCPPSLGLLTINTLTAADSVLIPIQCEYYALEGLTQLMQTIELVQDNLNPSLAVEGVLLTMFDKRLNLANQVAEEARRHFGNKVYQTVIPRNVKLSESPSFGKPILYYDAQSTGAESYMDLAREIVARQLWNESTTDEDRAAVEGA